MAFKRPSPSPFAIAARRREQLADFGGYCAAKLSIATKPFTVMVPKDPLRQAMGGVLMTGDHTLFLIGSDANVMVNMV